MWHKKRTHRVVFIHLHTGLRGRLRILPQFPIPTTSTHTGSRIPPLPRTDCPISRRTRSELWRYRHPPHQTPQAHSCALTCASGGIGDAQPYSYTLFGESSRAGAGSNGRRQDESDALQAPDRSLSAERGRVALRRRAFRFDQFDGDAG